MKKIWNAVISGLMEIRYHKLRSALSLFGIILGVMNLSAMFSIINGAKTANEKIMEAMGTPDQIQVHLDWRKMRKAVEQKNMQLGWEDVDNIKKFASTVKDVGLEVYSHENVIYKKEGVRFTVVGLTPATMRMNKYTIVKGRTFTQFDMETGSRVCIVGSQVVTDVFKGKNPVGEKIRMRADYFTVIGVLEEYGAYFNTQKAAKKSKRGRRSRNPMEWKNRRVLLPATTMRQRFLGNASRNWFNLFAQSKSMELVPATIEEVRNILVKSHDDQDVFDIRSMVERQQEADDFGRIWQVILGVVAGISLMVGGVGIMNVMLASFRERMREIGIRKAIGASNVDIFLLFIVETIVICLIGGLIGLVFGYIVSTTALSSMLQETFNATAEFSFDAGLFAILFSMLIGLLSGLYPALKAANLSPVEALRYE